MLQIALGFLRTDQKLLPLVVPRQLRRFEVSLQLCDRVARSRRTCRQLTQLLQQRPFCRGFLRTIDDASDLFQPFDLEVEAAVVRIPTAFPNPAGR
jgi:hypothetical protein